MTPVRIDSLVTPQLLSVVEYHNKEAQVGYIKQNPRGIQALHQCEDTRPRDNNFSTRAPKEDALGTLWRCDECGNWWQVTSSGFWQRYWPNPYISFRSWFYRKLGR